jgi:nitroimidazol reductase NimA-like FMN-containing flavoprotein (pyridoxamine 5'-phosphate oxidase superfamily)
MPKDYSLAVTPANEQRRPKNALSDEWVKDFLRRAPIGHVATRWDDQPFITPTSFCTTKRSTPSSSPNIGRIRANSGNGRYASKPANTASFSRM